MLLSTSGQLKKLWRVFSGHFLNLVQHRFASHCCEVLFERSVVVASRELDPYYVAAHDETTSTDEVFASMESLFLYMLNVRLISTIYKYFSISYFRFIGTQTPTEISSNPPFRLPPPPRTPTNPIRTAGIQLCICIPRPVPQKEEYLYCLRFRAPRGAGERGYN